MPQLQQAFGLDLPRTFPADAEVLPQFRQRVAVSRPPVSPAGFRLRKKTQLNHLRFFRDSFGTSGRCTINRSCSMRLRVSSTSSSAPCSSISSEPSSVAF